MWLILQNCGFLFDTRNVPVQDIHKFYRSLTVLLPCPMCQGSYREYLQEIPLPDHHFAEWVFRIHNRVNRKLNVQHIDQFTQNVLPMQEWLQKKYLKILDMFETKGLFRGPDFEIVRTRFYFHIDDPLPMRDILSVFIALLTRHGYIPEVLFFAEMIDRVHPIPRILQALKDKQPKEAIIRLKFTKNHEKYAELIRSGAQIPM
jgi:hypothetical protein